MAAERPACGGRRRPAVHRRRPGVGGPPDLGHLPERDLLYLRTGSGYRRLRIHVAPRALVGVFPTHDDEACVWLCAPDETLQPLLRAGSAKASVLWSMIADATPNLAERLHSTEITAPVRGAVNLPNQVRRPTGPGWALVGDAGYHRDPITGHGISDAFRDAELLARAIDGHLTQQVPWAVAGWGYDRARTVALHDIFAITQALTRFPGAGSSSRCRSS